MGYEFHIPRGSKHAEKVVVSGQGHEIPDAANGDLVIVLRCVKHDLYQRIGADLAMTKKITLKEALCGFDILIPHLSGHKLRLKSEPNEIVQHSQLKAVFSKGMPQKGSGNTFGHLYVKLYSLMNWMMRRGRKLQNCCPWVRMRLIRMRSRRKRSQWTRMWMRMMLVMMKSMKFMKLQKLSMENQK